MNLADALDYLHRYQQWQTGAVSMLDADISTTRTKEAIAAILTYVPQLQKNYLSVCSNLRKCQVKRQEYNLELRRQLKSSRSADLQSAPEPPSPSDRGF